METNATGKIDFVWEVLFFFGSAVTAIDLPAKDVDGTANIAHPD